MQLLQLRHAHDVAGLRTTQTMPALRAAEAADLIDHDSATALAASWQLASTIRNATMLVRGRPSDSLPQQQDLAAVAFLCGYDVAEASRLRDDYRRGARRAATAVHQVFWG
ncbi:MAG: hypothetical protein WKF76_02565 [Nocardioidaceae bacterium]